MDEDYLSDVGGIIVELLDEYYTADSDAQYVDVELLKSRVDRRYPKQSEYLHHVLDNLEEVSSTNVEKDFIEMRKGGLNQALGSAFLEGDESKITELLTRYNSFTEHLNDQEESSVYVGESFETLLQHDDPGNRIKVYPKALNERLGNGLPKPSHILLFARPETGKSAACINMASGFVNHGHRTLYIGNEDNPLTMVQRFMCRLSGMTIAEVRANPEKAYERAKEKGYDDLIFAGLHPGSLLDIRRLIEKYEPECVLVDQIHNLNHKNDNKVERLEVLSRELRNMSNEYEVLMVSVTQAGDSAQDKLILDQGDVDYSNTGIPGNVDAMIGIGMDEAADRGGYRFMTPCKNKPGGGDHSPIKVLIEPAYSRYRSA